MSFDYQDDLSEGLAIFNRTNGPYALLVNLEEFLNDNNAQNFLLAVRNHLESALNGKTPEQEADSHLFGESEGCHGWFTDFELIEN